MRGWWNDGRQHAAVAGEEAGVVSYWCVITEINGRDFPLHFTVAQLRRECIAKFLGMWSRGRQASWSWRRWRNHGYRVARVRIVEVVD